MACLSRGWFMFDLALVSFSVAHSWVVKPALVSAGTPTGGGDIFQRLIVLRALRLLRTLRALRVLPLLKASWRMVSGLLESWSTMISMLLLLLLVLYLFACLGLEVITKDENVQQTLREHHLVGNFGSLPMIMLTLVQFVTLDSVAGIYYPIISHHPELVLFFFPVIIVVSISLMNLVTAVLVEGGLTLASHDLSEMRREKQRMIKRLDPEFRSFFQRVDADGDGLIQLIEMEHLPISWFPDALLDKVRAESLLELFDFLDADGSGEVTESEFVDGLLNLVLADNDVISTDTFMLIKLMRVTKSKSDHIEETVQHIKTGVEVAAQRIARLNESVAKLSHRSNAMPPVASVMMHL
eukprot:NODE_1092_length_1242_cov_445.692502.p1 GENE.NODE_1092_length_1242_cov_445.692502~~NODE_1092_length_1242_cov_445.692502.p1  ORF type:complete len:363 (-),score=153.68 NODE_1092_length_1242_cov_445.692502:152-1213(-)